VGLVLNLLGRAASWNRLLEDLSCSLVNTVCAGPVIRHLMMVVPSVPLPAHVVGVVIGWHLERLLLSTCSYLLGCLKLLRTDMVVRVRWRQVSRLWHRWKLRLAAWRRVHLHLAWTAATSVAARVVLVVNRWAHVEWCVVSWWRAGHFVLLRDEPLLEFLYLRLVFYFLTFDLGEKKGLIMLRNILLLVHALNPASFGWSPRYLWSTL